MAATQTQSERIYNEMKALSIGATKIINGISVTRCSEGKFETGTLGRSTMPFTVAFDIVLNQ